MLHGDRLILGLTREFADVFGGESKSQGAQSKRESTEEFGGMALASGAPPALRRSLRPHVPALPGWADVWRTDLRVFLPGWRERGRGGILVTLLGH